ncbi:hypothetical protein [Microbacterium azadirachtae]|uniref:Polyketide cyclase / dehydrase and lipid transport n=1 Tax=Microbacterium azadirachtae TaxID=582680 RepID=A0A0F0LLR2_9MICO|nr:hypothetical protein [Microbacterium azadirachtae]KJL33634.1 hypothetical protein RL72_00099 [Microbacterium azadirachtae]SDL84231.1 hypothetical protein SAMN04488593_1892 [Microbacterium azadirachtae]SEG22656.1 hypothetical protein SAMN04488594_2287 [Microbacterium azadirachtae]SEG24958.1 hypothetical protein SAMN04488592_2297 [Microbacterium azadirachtae]
MTPRPRRHQVQLRFRIRASADAAWAALHSPAVLTSLYAPVLVVEPLTHADEGSLLHSAVRLRLFGRITVGTQLIGAYDETREHHGETVRILRDSGIPLTGPLASLDIWDHRMAVSPLPDGRALWRDRLVFGGPGSALLLPVLWVAWQWRGLRIRRLARGWDRAAAEDDGPASAGRAPVSRRRAPRPGRPGSPGASGRPTPRE